MPYEDLCSVLQNIKNHIDDTTKITVVITGGEPLVRKDLEKCGIEIRKLGFKWGIVTNGFQYSPERHQTLMNAGMGSLTLSVDGFEDSHNWLRNNNKSFNKTISALDIITLEKKLNYDIVTCVNQKNFEELHELKNYFLGKRVKAWRLFTISPIGRALDDPELLLRNEQLKELMDFIKVSRSENNMNIKFSCEGFTGPYESEVRDNYYFCRAGINIASVLADGSIAACPNIDPAFSQGNIYRDDFMDIWENKYQLMRKRDWMKTGICTYCEAFKWCKGNGLHWRKAGDTEVLRCHYRMLC